MVYIISFIDIYPKYSRHFLQGDRAMLTFISFIAFILTVKELCI